MMFRVGQRVVCIASNWVGNDGCIGGTILPERGEVYTVRWIGLSVIGTRGTFVRLREIHNRPVRSIEAYFDARWFRPIVERETDISFAHEILRNVGGKVDA